MVQRWQYQGLFEPVSTSPETVVVDKWFRELSRPLFVEQRVAEVPYFSLVEFSIPSAVSIDMWFSGLSLPVSRKQVNHAAYSFVSESLVTEPDVGTIVWLRRRRRQL